MHWVMHTTITPASIKQYCSSIQLAKLPDEGSVNNNQQLNV